MTTQTQDTSVTTQSSPRKEAPGILKRTNAYFIDPMAVDRRPGWNPRFDFGDIENTLAVQIKEQHAVDGVGLLVPIRVKRKEGGRFELIDGDRRQTAVELLMKKGLKFEQGIPAIIVDKNQDDVRGLIQMFVSNEGKPFLPLEEAEAYNRMRQAGMTIKQICAAVGRASTHVTSILALVDADQSVKDAVVTGAINKTQAKDIARVTKGDKELQQKLVEEAKRAATKPGGKKEKGKVIAKKLDEVKRKRAAAKGKTLKMRALTDEQLSQLGTKVAELLDLKVKAAAAEPLNEMTEDHSLEGLRTFVSCDDLMSMAFTLGALEALKAAAGMEIDLDI